MNSLHDFHWFDVCIVAALVIAALIGARRGLLRQTGRLAAYVVAFYVALWLHGRVDAFLRTHLAEVADKVSELHSFLATYVMTYFVYFMGSRFLHKLVRCFSEKKKSNADTLDILGLKPIDRLLGAAVGALAMCLLIGGGLIGLGSISNEQVSAQLAGSKLAPRLVQDMHAILNAVPERKRAEFTQALARLEQAGRSLATDLTAEGVQRGTDHLGTALNGVEYARHLAAHDAFPTASNSIDEPK